MLLTVGVAFLASRPQPPRMVETLQRQLGTSTQLPVRIVLLLITGLVLIASSLSLEILLGAFAAGLIVRIAFDRDQAVAMQPRLESIGFGFLIPVFFVVSGMEFHAYALFHSAATLERVPIFLGLFLVVRGLPALFVYVKVLKFRQRVSLGVLQPRRCPCWSSSARSVSPPTACWRSTPPPWSGRAWSRCSSSRWSASPWPDRTPDPSSASSRTGPTRPGTSCSGTRAPVGTDQAGKVTNDSRS